MEERPDDLDIDNDNDVDMEDVEAMVAKDPQQLEDDVERLVTHPDVEAAIVELASALTPEETEGRDERVADVAANIATGIADTFSKLTPTKVDKLQIEGFTRVKAMSMLTDSILGRLKEGVATPEVDKKGVIASISNLSKKLFGTLFSKEFGFSFLALIFLGPIGVGLFSATRELPDDLRTEVRVNAIITMLIINVLLIAGILSVGVTAAVLGGLLAR